MEGKPTRIERKEYRTVLELRRLLRETRAKRDAFIMTANKEGMSYKIEQEINVCDSEIVEYEEKLKVLDK